MDQATLDRAWQVATTFLAIPDCGFDILYRYEDIGEAKFLRLTNRDKKPSREVIEAFVYLMKPFTMGLDVAEDMAQRNILDWYAYEMRRHFLKNFRGGLYKVGCKSGVLQIMCVVLIVECTASKLSSQRKVAT